MIYGKKLYKLSFLIIILLLSSCGDNDKKIVNLESEINVLKYELSATKSRVSQLSKYQNDINLINISIDKIKESNKKLENANWKNYKRIDSLRSVLKNTDRRFYVFKTETEKNLKNHSNEINIADKKIRQLNILTDKNIEQINSLSKRSNNLDLKILQQQKDFEVALANSFQKSSLYADSLKTILNNDIKSNFKLDSSQNNSILKLHKIVGVNLERQRRLNNEVYNLNQTIEKIEKQLDNLEDKYYTPSFYILFSFLLLLFIPIFWFFLIEMLKWLISKENIKNKFPIFTQKIKNFINYKNKNAMNKEYVNIPSESKLDKLKKVSKLFIIPTVALLSLLLFDFILNAFGLTKIKSFKSFIDFFNLLFQIIFPIILLSFVFITFYSSYRILKSKDHKNLTIFLLIQFISYFIFIQLDLGNIPVINDKIISVILTFVSTGIVVAVLYFPTKKIEDEINLSEKTNIEFKNIDDFKIDTNSNAGLVVSAIYSFIIAAMIYFRVIDGINFISWGILFGISIAIILIKGEKTILGLFYFINPSNAKELFYLHHIKEIKEKVNLEKDIILESNDVIRDYNRIQSEKIEEAKRRELEELKVAYLSKLASSFSDFEKQKYKAQYEHYQKIISSQLEQLENSNLSIEERFKINEKVEKMLRAIKENDNDITKITKSLELSVPLSEKISKNLGLTDEEKEDAVQRGLIVEEQKFLWSKNIQLTIKKGIEDYNNNNINSTNSLIFITNSILKEFKLNSNIIVELIKKIKEKSIKSEDIIGLKYHLKYFILKTINKDYIIIYKEKDNNILIHSIVEEE